MLTAEELEAGIHGWLEAALPVVRFALAPDILASRSGWRFQDSWDDLDDVKVAVIERGDGVRFTIVRHVGDAAGVDLHLPPGASDLDVERAIESLPVSDEEITWRATSQRARPATSTQKLVERLHLSFERLLLRLDTSQHELGQREADIDAIAYVRGIAESREQLRSGSHAEPKARAARG
jgi:hypothetical protein